MSQMTSAARVGARPLNRPTTTTTTTRLRVVTGAPPRHGGAAFGIVCATLLAAGLIGLLLLNTALAQGSFTLHDLRATSARLTDTEEALAQSLEVSKSPADIAARAAGMGMVPAQSAAFLRLSDGKVIGVATPAKAPSTLTVDPKAAPAPASVQGPAKPASSARPASSAKPAVKAPPKPATR
ncbi:MAG: hypothetical protein ACYCV4_05045 [Dermatophilaceae bacterium]